VNVRHHEVTGALALHRFGKGMAARAPTAHEQFGMTYLTGSAVNIGDAVPAYAPGDRRIDLATNYSEISWYAMTGVYHEDFQNQATQANRAY
jgi:hypothetical protein